MKLGTQFPRATIIVPTILALAVGVGIGWQVRAPMANADESATVLAATETDRFYQALSGNGALADVLGDSFQLIRSDGARYDRDAYLADSPTVSDYSLGDFAAVRSGDILTATFFSTNTAVVEDVEHETVGRPRLAVFSKEDSAWKLQAFANLGLGLAGDIQTEARRAVELWVAAAASGNVDTVGDVLAPEFQIVRSNGAAYAKDAYLAGGLPKIDAVIEVDEIVATGFGDHIVVRYNLNVDEAVAGGRIEGRAPRMTVFRRSGDAWLVVAHANFGRVEQ